MNLVVLVAMVVVGVSMVVLLVHVTGGSRRARLADADAARQRFLTDHPDLPVGAVVLTADGDAAFLALDGRLFGLVQAVGSHFLTRLLDGGAMARIARDGASIELALADFTFAGGRYTFASPADADAAWSMVEAARRDAFTEQPA